MESIIELKNISKSYIINKEKLVVLNNINYKFFKGKFYVIVGNSGSGKTTLIKIIGLLDNCYDGEYKLYGKSINNLKDLELSLIRNKKIGFIFQDFYLDSYLKLYENVMMPLLINNMKKRDMKRICFKVLKELGLVERINHYPNQLSGGEQQRVSIARAIVNNPDIILADEPIGNLDKENSIKILEMLKELSKNGKCVIMVSHNDIAKKYADKVLLLNDNQLTEVDNEK